MVEGESDEKALPILIRKIVPHSQGVKALNLGGRDNLLNIRRVTSVIKFNLQTSPTISKVLLCVDSECTDIKDTSKQVLALEHQLQQSFPNLSLRYMVIDHSLEGWLLHDRSALQRLLGADAQFPKYGNPENNCQPAQLIEESFRLNNQEYKKTMHAPRLAELLDIDTIAKASETLPTFQQAVRG